MFGEKSIANFKIEEIDNRFATISNRKNIEDQALIKNLGGLTSH